MIRKLIIPLICIICFISFVPTCENIQFSDAEFFISETDTSTMKNPFAHYPDNNSENTFPFCSVNTTFNQTVLYIYSNVKGFEVWWDGHHIFTTPSDKDWCWFYCVSAGKHTITLKKSGCADASVVVNIISGVQNEVTIYMQCSDSGSSGNNKDSDEDGVLDSKDRCSNPGCNIVDSSGCPKDSDSDGVNDCEDDCPYEKGSASNNGCKEHEDRDNDGITDDRDSCYNPDCRIIDSSGCPKDSDSDGVNDCEDDCPYEKGSASNNGCKEDYSTNILRYWWIIIVLFGVLGSIIYLNKRRPPKLKM